MPIQRGDFVRPNNNRTAVVAELGSLRGCGIDMRNPHTRKAGPGRRHQQGQACYSSRTTAA